MIALGYLADMTLALDFTPTRADVALGIGGSERVPG